MQLVGATRPAAWVFQRTLYPVDRLLFRRTEGRITVPGIVTGLPVVLLTTTGARSGQPRTMPLVRVPMGDELALIGSNYGQERTPGWVFNLEADPNGTLRYRDREVGFVARRASDEETDLAFARAAQLYSGYAHYRDRADHRTIRVFLLRADDDAG